jgi:hypothetical protein
LNSPNTTEATNPAIPTATQLAEARLKQWHQQGEALLTIENLRSWINAAGLVLYLPRPEIASPAPSLVEAVLGRPNPNPTLEQASEARGLLSRLVAEGLAVPLNLLGAGAGTVHAGAPGDTPDFVASTAVFSYVFTLRGDKAWKQPPSTAGALKVSHLALATYEALLRRGPLTAYDLTTEVGKEVTEAAVLRALGELWTHLRVLPLLQSNGGATLWEPASARFTKQIKAGANAGQPSALSALISLYLGQGIVAAEEEIESFLSPLAPRSRIRDVIHALLAARQLDTVAVEGRTMLYVASSLPAFPSPEPRVVSEVQAIAVSVAAVETDVADGADGNREDASRITKFVPKPRKIGTGYLAKAKPASSRPKPIEFKPFGSKPAWKPRADARPASGRERRPFAKPASPGFDKPWEEDKERRLSAARRPSEIREPSPNAAAAKSGDEAVGTRPPRKTFSKPGTFARKREGFAARSMDGDARPPRRDFTSSPGQRSSRKPERQSESSERPAFNSPRAAGSYAPRPKSDRPRDDRPRRPEGGGFAPRNPYHSRAAAGDHSGKPRFSQDGKPATKYRGDGPRRNSSSDGGKRVYRKFDAPRSEVRRDRPALPQAPDRPARPYSSDRSARPAGAGGGARKPAGDFTPRKFKAKGKPGGYEGKTGRKPSGGFAGKRPSSKPAASSSGKPAGTFAKFVGNKKPFGKRPPARKFKPSQGESA